MIGTAIGLGLGVVSSAITSLSGLKRAREAKRAIAEIEANRLEYENNFNDTQVSTLGADIQKEQLRQNNASLIGNLRSGGSRAMIGAIPQLLVNNNTVSRTIGADLDEQQKYIDLKAADYQNKIQEVYDQRQRDALIGYGTELNAARQDITTGLNNAAGIALAASPYLDGNKKQTNQVIGIV